MKRATTWQRYAFTAAGLLLLGMVSLGISPPLPVQVALLAALVVLLGLPHGALDPLVARKASLWRTPLGLLGFLLLYLVLVAAALGVWIWLPGVALGSFLAFSAWHFSRDWSSALPRAVALCAGAMIISGPALFHADETTRYFAMLSDETAARSLVAGLRWVALPAIAGNGVGILYGLRRSSWTSIELAMLLICVALLPPLLFFLLYFCGVHSPRHLILALDGLKPAPASWTALVFTLLAVLGAAIAFYLLPEASSSARYVQVVFIGLAVLTVPHMILIEYAAERQLQPH